ncbi:hypothetical protein AVEN_7617-1 [Araneus ventricosus]|uniref:Uncharacterized protein n=1 Tax=Araneus ventricosus TaxID=182803 RepID=A0A4Y2N304_ARAVE|nr:hypothetical protein AVEN_7617-1 [Araneus ventricosus]
MGFSNTLPRLPITEYTRFLILHTPKTFHRVSPFLVQRLISSIIGDVKDTKKLPSGDLLIEAASKTQISVMRSLEKLGDFPIEVTPHRNYSRGVISEPDLFDCSETELNEELQSQKVRAAHRIKVKRSGSLIPTKHVILTFCRPELPKSIHAGYVYARVKPYVPNPLRCFNVRDSDIHRVLAKVLAVVRNDTSVCVSENFKCCNCSGSHPAYSRDCSKWKMEKEIQSLKVKRNISYAEAKKLVLDRTPKPGISYSAAMRPTLKSTGAQTVITDIISLHTESSPPVHPKTSYNKLALSEFTSAHLPKKKRRRAKTLPNVNVSIPGSPPEPPKPPDPSDNTVLSDAVLKICPSASDLSDVDMDHRPSNPPSPGDHV